MSILDKTIAAVTPPESDESRAKARADARAAAQPGDWLSLVLDHHLKIEAAFAAVKAAGDAASRTGALKKLGAVLTGHSIAEEGVIYPALAQADEKAHADMAYTEQAAAKMQMAALENLAPMSQDFLDKLEHIRGAVAHHVFEEEGKWFLELKEKASADVQAKLTQRYKQEFDRYMGPDAAGERSGAPVEPRTWTAPPPAI
ncbi:MAG TPA: hemerythrin domain-containing protein [Caulobacteraceae bacterium]